MTRITGPAARLTRARGRGSLLSILEKETLLSKIKVFPDGGFVAQTMDWDSYWKPLLELDCGEMESSLNALYSAWRDHLRSGFSSLVRRNFCLRYFSLLDVFLSDCRQTIMPQQATDALQALLGFECFGISLSTSEAEVLGAGTCTLRNPCYLLARLKMPDVPDDPQFLPIITVAGTERAELFYHYRQYTLSFNSPLSLLFYLAISEVNRSASFRLINSLIGSISYAIDPRTHERARRLCVGIIHPIIQSSKPTDASTIALELIDVGAGSGRLAASLCRQIQALGASMGFEPKFRLWFVDLDPADPARFFRHRGFRGFVDSLTFLGDDYRDWLSKSQPLPPANGLRIAVISRLFNNLSRFSIRSLSKRDLLPLVGTLAASLDPDAYLPSRCLASSGRGVESLAISNARVILEDGRTFPQMSLSQFYHGLRLISAPSVETFENSIFLPIRTPNPQCLVTSDDGSVISRIAENCDYIIIEDADLRPKDLVEHMTAFSLGSIAIQEVTKVLGLSGNRAYVIWSKNAAIEPQFLGERIW